jgi:hypothetical protein
VHITQAILRHQHTTIQNHALGHYFQPVDDDGRGFGDRG